MLDREDIICSRECRGAFRFYIWRMLPVVDVVGNKPVFIRIRYRFLRNRTSLSLQMFPIVFRYRLVGCVDPYRVTVKIR